MAIPFFQSFIDAAKARKAAAAAKVAAAAKAAREAAKAAQAKAAADAVAKAAIDEYQRLNYYVESDFAAYQYALAHRVADANGVKPFINPADFHTEPMTLAQWASLTPAEKAARGTIHFD